jgi:hypothetical protein
MLRFTLLLIIGYIIWKIVQVVIKIYNSTRSRYNSVRQAPQNKKPAVQQFTDVKDAEFKDLPPEPEKHDDKAKSSE